MSFLGIGGLEFLLLAAVAFFILGPKRMLEGIREGRKFYANLKRQREELQSMITEAIDLDELKKQIDSEGLLTDAKALKEELALDQVAEDVRSATDIGGGSVSRSRQLNRPPAKGGDDVRAAIPDLNLSGSNGDATASPEAKEADPDEVES